LNESLSQLTSVTLSEASRPFCAARLGFPTPVANLNENADEDQIAEPGLIVQGHQELRAIGRANWNCTIRIGGCDDRQCRARDPRWKEAVPGFEGLDHLKAQRVGKAACFVRARYEGVLELVLRQIGSGIGGVSGEIASATLASSILAADDRLNSSVRLTVP
jgi:hypothetical protein